jgi:predicted DNA-binding protein (UPF0251 family)
VVGLMERAPLRPVPARPAGPIDPAAAVREVEAALPALEPLEVRALALVALADRPRAEAAAVLGIEQEVLRALLSGARKELRQTLTPLSGSGWCERAEGLISDRLDGAVGDPDRRRLDVHLRNCPRCVEHERRLVQATDALLAGIAPARPAPVPAAGDAPLTAVPPEGERPEGELPEGELPEELKDAALKEGAPAESGPTPAEPGPTPAEPGSTPAEPGPTPAEPGSTPAERLPAAREPAAPASAAPTSAQITAAAEVLVTARTRRQLAAAITWNAMIAIAVILTVASIVLIVAGALGAHL